MFSKAGAGAGAGKHFDIGLEECPHHPNSKAAHSVNKACLLPGIFAIFTPGPCRASTQELLSGCRGCQPGSGARREGGKHSGTCCPRWHSWAGPQGCRAEPFALVQSVWELAVTKSSASVSSIFTCVAGEMGLPSSGYEAGALQSQASHAP